MPSSVAALGAGGGSGRGAAARVGPARRAVDTSARTARPTPTRPAISILKPLCGLDDRLAGNLLQLRRPPLSELRSAARRVAARPMPPTRSPGRRRGGGRTASASSCSRAAPGLNPKVNQLVTLARRARHDILVDQRFEHRASSPTTSTTSRRIFEDPSVGLVTHPLVGDGETEVGRAPGRDRRQPPPHRRHHAGRRRRQAAGAQGLRDRQVDGDAPRRSRGAGRLRVGQGRARRGLRPRPRRREHAGQARGARRVRS